MAAPCMLIILGRIALLAFAIRECVALHRLSFTTLGDDQPLVQNTSATAPFDLRSTEEMCLVLDFRWSKQLALIQQRREEYRMLEKLNPPGETATRRETGAEARMQVLQAEEDDAAPRSKPPPRPADLCELDEVQYLRAKCPPGPYMSQEVREERELRLLRALCAAKKHHWIVIPEKKYNPANDHYKTRHYMTFESSAWPKPGFCSDPTNTEWHHNHPWIPVYRTDFAPLQYKKLRCSRHKVDFLKSWKVASMTFPSYLECEYPECQWEEVSVTDKLRSEYTTLTAVRDPLARWISAAGELLERVVNGWCPSGPCSDADGYVNGTGKGSTANMVRHQTTWYSHLKPTRADYSDEDVTALVTAMVHDTKCNRRSYASEHLSTQSNFVTQNQGPAADLSYVMKLEAADEGLKTLSQHIAGASPSGKCSLVPSNVKECKPKGENILSEEDFLGVLSRNSNLMKAICLVYAQDFICFDYTLPEACKNMY